MKDAACDTLTIVSEFPRTSGDLTEEWLQAALGSGKKSNELAVDCALQVRPIADGVTAEVVRLTFESRLAGPGRLGSLEATLPMIAKFRSTNAKFRQYAHWFGLYEREVGFYRDLGRPRGVIPPGISALREELAIGARYFLVMLSLVVDIVNVPLSTDPRRPMQSILQVIDAALEDFPGSLTIRFAGTARDPGVETETNRVLSGPADRS